MGGVEWVDGLPKVYNFGDGRIYWEDPTPNGEQEIHIQYRLMDHLGNTMVFFEDKDEDGFLITELDSPSDPEDLEVIQRLWYYPFGMDMQGIGQATATPDQAYRYNGKELDESTGLYDYGARYYDPAIGRWGQVDPLAEEYAPYSPYNYVLGNPIRLTDPDGQAPSDVIRDKDGNIVYASKGETIQAKHPSGPSATLEVGYIFADDGTPIQVFRNPSQSNEEFCTNCHGTSFADGEFWLNNDQVPALVSADGYEAVEDLENLSADDKVLYLSSSGEVEHSVTVEESTDCTLSGTCVTGLGGMETNVHTDPADDAWPRAKGVAIVRKNTPDRVVSEKEKKALINSITSGDNE